MIQTGNSTMTNLNPSGKRQSDLNSQVTYTINTKDDISKRSSIQTGNLNVNASQVSTKQNLVIKIDSMYIRNSLSTCLVHEGLYTT
jgi:hypothetical protein